MTRPKKARPAKRGPGHPPTGRTVPILIRLAPEDVERLDELAARVGQSRAAWVQETVRMMAAIQTGHEPHNLADNEDAQGRLPGERDRRLP